MTFEDGNYACLASPRLIKHLRQDPDFRECARYPGCVPVNQLMPGMGLQPPQIPFLNNPNTLIMGGSQVGQASFVNGSPVLPTGFVFEGVRWFECTNLPTAKVQLTYNGLTDGENPALHPTGSGIRDGHLGIVFGPQAVGMGVGGAGPEVLLNNNDDFQRFIIAIWRIYGSWALLNQDFVEVIRTFGS